MLGHVLQEVDGSCTQVSGGRSRIRLREPGILHSGPRILAQLSIVGWISASIHHLII
jgi:hypothetical protein